MIRRTLAALALLALALVGWGGAADDVKLSVKVEDDPPPKELGEAVRGLLAAKGVSVVGGDGKVLCTAWPRKGLESKATADQVKAGLPYADLDESTVVGAVRFPDVFSDYRKQQIKPGVHTLRPGIQPMDGDHMGTAPYNEFLLLCPAAKDQKPDRLEAKELQELSAGATGRKHPGVMLLFPNPQPADQPAVEAKTNDTWVLSFPVAVKAGPTSSPSTWTTTTAGTTASCAAVG